MARNLTPYPRAYGDFRGVDYANNKVNLLRSHDALNVWKDYTDSEGVAIETREDINSIHDFGGATYGIHKVVISNVTHVLVHAGTKLLRWTNYPNTTVTTSELYTSMNEHESFGVVYDEKLYLKDGANYLVYDGSTIATVVSVATIPTTSNQRTPSGNGSFYQQINILQPKRKNSFIADGTSVDYTLDATDLDVVSTYTMTAVVNGVSKVETIDFTVNRTTGVVTFLTAPAAPSTSGQDNVIITYSKTVSEYATLIENCTIMTEFDKRIFVSGNPDLPSKVYNSALNDPTYFGDLSYSTLGTDINTVKTLIPGNNVLWGIKDGKNHSVFYQTPRLDSVYGKLYPNQQSNVVTGCNSTGINFGDDIVFMSSEGLKGIENVDIQSENLLGHRSSMIDPKLLSVAGTAKMAEYQGYLIILLGNNMYLADSRQKWLNEDTKSYEYEWFYWNTGFDTITANYIKVIDDILYIGDEEGNLYYLGGTPTELNSYICTAHDNFGTDSLRKSSNKRGSTINGSGDMTISIAKDRGAYTTVKTITGLDGKDTFKPQAKKCQEISFKISSTTSFKLYSMATEVFVGGYCK